MTRYQGGKNRIGKELYEVMREIESQFFDDPLPLLEPFCGMCGVTRHFNDGRDIYASDLNEDIVVMWQKLKKGWIPPLKVTQESYDKLKYSNKSSAERGFVGSACSFSGAFFGGFTGKYIDKSKNDAKIGWNSIQKILPSLKKATFMDAGSYTDYEPSKYLIYCDPPYKRTVKINGSKNLKDFNHDIFWGTMRKWSEKNLVFISEESAPKDFIEVWSKTIARHPGNSPKRQGRVIRKADKLFLHKSWADHISH